MPSYDTLLTRPLTAGGRAPARYAGSHLQAPAVLGQDWRFATSTLATIKANNRVMVKAEPDSPEAPMPGARVRLHRLSDGYLVWQGISDASGYYHARHLEPGVKYVPVAIDLTGTYECVASGPVTAELPDA